MKISDLVHDLLQECSHKDPFWRNLLLLRPLYHSPKRDNPRFLYSAIDPQKNQKYVIKVVFSLSSSLPELDIVSSLSHPNIIRFEKVASFDGWWILCMRYASGGDLVDLLERKGKIPEDRARKIFHQVFEALKYLHHEGITHKDLKLDNLLLAENDRIILTDFEFAQRLSHSPTSPLSVFSKNSSPRCGTYVYSSPEGRMGLFSGYESDIWAAGVSLFSLIYGKFPFSTDCLKVHQEMKSFREDEKDPTVSAQCKDLLKHLLDVNPTRRYTAVQAFDHPWIHGGSSHLFGLIDQTKKVHHEQLQIQHAPAQTPIPAEKSDEVKRVMKLSKSSSAAAIIYRAVQNSPLKPETKNEPINDIS